MEGYIYIGGALGVGTSTSRFCPVLMKTDKDLNLMWAYWMSSCGSSSETGWSAASAAIDMIYPEQLNDKVYALSVARAYSGTLASSTRYLLYVTFGNGDESNAGPTDKYQVDCTMRRVEVITVKPDNIGSTSFYWRPLGMTYS